MKTHNARIKAERMAARRERKKKAAAQKSRKPDAVTFDSPTTATAFLKSLVARGYQRELARPHLRLMTAEPLRGADYFQVKPGEWALPDVAVLANGTQLGGARARLYWLLRWTAERGATHSIGRHTGPVGWVPSHVCKEPWSGGGAGDRRLRDLRERGVRLESQVYIAPDGERTSTWLWRWCGDPPAGDTERAPTASRARGAAHRGRLVFRTQSGCPVERDGWVKWEVSPGSGHVLAPPSSLQAALITGHVTHDQAVAQYLDILRRRYSAGELDGVLSTRCAVLWVRPEVALDPLPTLRSVLVRCGAELNSDEK